MLHHACLFVTFVVIKFACSIHSLVEKDATLVTNKQCLSQTLKCYSFQELSRKYVVTALYTWT